MGAGRLFRYRLSSARQKTRSTRRRALIKSERAGQQTSSTCCSRCRSSCSCCWLWHSSQRFTYGFQASKESSLKRKSNKSFNSVSQEAYPSSSEPEAKSDYRCRPNSMNDRRGRGCRMYVCRRRSFVGDFSHRHLLSRPAKNQLPRMSDRL